MPTRLTLFTQPAPRPEEAQGICFAQGSRPSSSCPLITMMYGGPLCDWLWKVWCQKKKKNSAAWRRWQKTIWQHANCFGNLADWRLQQGRGGRPRQPVASCGGLLRGARRGGPVSSCSYLHPPLPLLTIPTVSFFRMCLICCSCLAPPLRPGPYLRHYSAVHAGATEPAASQPFLPVSAQIHSRAGWQITC